MKKARALVSMIFTCGLFLILVGLLIFRKDEIKSILDNHVFHGRNDVALGEKNEYYRDYDFEFVQNTEDFTPKEMHDIINIFYTVLNSGQNSFTFYCDKDYDTCIQDVNTLANDQEMLSAINNYVHPFNGFSHIETEYDTLGRITMSVVKSYSGEQIEEINQYMDSLYPVVVHPNQSLEDNIKSVHDYIINHTKYDTEHADHNDMTYQSDIAYGPLFQGYALCGGYTDLMELFLERMGVKSYKVSSDDHVWNAVYLNDEWVHLDLTWDDPVASDGYDYLEYTYYLVSTEELLTADTKNIHDFKLEYYPELK